MRRAAAGLALIVLPGLLADAAHGADGAEPVAVDLEVSLDAGPLEIDELELAEPATGVFEHELLVVARDALRFDTRRVRIDAPGTPLDDVDVTVGLTADSDVFGAIDAQTGHVTLVGAFVLHLSAPDVLSGCPVGPVHVDPDDRRGVAYDADSGTATVVDPSFSIPAVTSGTAGCDGREDDVNVSLELPRTPSRSTLTIELQVTEADGSGADDGGTGGLDPGTSDPGTTDPGTTDPGTTDPGASDPDGGVTGPGTTDTTAPSSTTSPPTSASTSTTADPTTTTAGVTAATSSSTSSTLGPPGGDSGSGSMVAAAHARRARAGGAGADAATEEESRPTTATTVWNLDGSVVVDPEPDGSTPGESPSAEGQRPLAAPVAATPSDTTAQRVVVLLGSAVLMAVAFRLLRSEALAGAVKRRRARPGSWI